MATNPSPEVLPLIRIENTGAAQTNVPFTFGQVLKVGAIKPGQGLEARLSNGDLIPLQVDYKATHADGSARHAIISGVLPTLFEKEERSLQLVTTKAVQSAPSKATVAPAGAVELTIEGVKYTATLAATARGPLQWLSGPVAQEWIAELPLLDPKGQPHSHLTLRVGARWYAVGPIRIEVIVENTKTWISARKLSYDAAVSIAGKKVFEQNGLTHYRHARWRKTFWTGQAPAVHIKHDIAYLIDSKAVSNYDRGIVPVESELVNLGKSINAANTGPMAIGPMMAYMPTTGGRGDIGPLPSWSVMYLLSMDKRAKDVMMSAAEGSGSWSVHYRDEKTGYPIRTDSEATKNITTHGNLWAWGPLPVPRYVNNDGALGATPYTEDTAHQSSVVYLPYLVSGEYYYLEELHFWAAWNPLGTDPKNHGNGAGLVRWQQVRGQAWSLRTLGHAAYITPDADPMKGYFTKQLDNNLNFYHATYVAGNPNKLGVYDGSGEGSFGIQNSPVWQDDFLTWSFGYLAELGFEKAAPILRWKATYPVGRMTAPGFCWIQAASYALKFREAEGKPVYDTFAQLYETNWGSDEIITDSGAVFHHPQGLKFIDQPCGSQAQADFLALANKAPWPAKRMAGFSDSVIGYPANLQPALAVAADAGAPNAQQAWTVFHSRAAKPDYAFSPQWAIVPRVPVVEVVTPPVVTPPVVTPPVVTPPVVTPPVVNPVPPVVTPAPAKSLTITTPANKELAKLKSLQVVVEDLNAMKQEQIFTGVTAAADGSVKVTWPSFTKSKKYQVTIRNEKYILVGVFYPMSAV